MSFFFFEIFDFFFLFLIQSNFRQDFDQHLDGFQGELDSLKELLKGDGYSLDANQILGVSGF